MENIYLLFGALWAWDSFRDVVDKDKEQVREREQQQERTRGGGTTTPAKLIS